MPLLTGTWTLFVDGVSAALDVSNIDASGRFRATLAGTAVSVLTNGQLDTGVAGSGFWNELGQEVTFTIGAGLIGGQTQRSAILLIFSGFQIQGAANQDPAQDVMWTLVGSYQQALAMPTGAGAGVVPPWATMAPLPHESARRTRFGWYAQIRQVI